MSNFPIAGQEQAKTLTPLAIHLGVKVESLVRLGVTADLEKKVYLWPERDSSGEVVSRLRHKTTGPKNCQKKAEPGKKRGLVFAVPESSYAGSSPNSPQIYTEGATDAAAAIDIGFEYVAGRPSASSTSDFLVDHSRGKHILLIGDNDPAGHTGMNRAAEKIYGTVEAVWTWIPPVEGHDLRDHFAAQRKLGVPDADIKQGILDGMECWEPPVEEKVGKIEPGLDEKGNYQETMTANALRFARMFQDRLRFNYDSKEWLIWNGKYWRPDKQDAAIEYAKKVSHAIWKDASPAKERPVSKKWASHSAGRQGLSNMLALAQPMMAVGISELDSDPFLLTVMNGTLDLRSGVLSKHEPADLITRICPVEYNPEARSEVWEKFLDDATSGDEELIRCLQSSVGYSLTGDTSEERLFFVYGPEASGKTTFLKAIQSVFARHCTTASFEVFLRCKRDTAAPRPDIARLAGARMVVAGEVDEERRLAEGIVKSVTGGDVVSARFLFKEEFEFIPEFKLWLVGNHAPTVNADDGAMWRRITVLPLDHTVPEDKRRPELKKELCDPAISGESILAWAVQGCLDWQKGGLAIPDSVTEATTHYREECDQIGEFIEDGCVVGEGLEVVYGRLYEWYRSWSAMRGESFISSRSFSKKLSQKGFPTSRSSDRTRVATKKGLAIRVQEGEIP